MTAVDVLFTITSKNVERNRLYSVFVEKSDCDRLIKCKPRINCKSREVEDGFILDFDQLQRLQTDKP